MSEFGNYEDCVGRFIEYARIDTTSDRNVKTVPSTEGQFVLAKKLFEELKDIGMEDVELDEKECVVFGTLPSNVEVGGENIPTIGFCSHLDTSEQEPGKNVNPQILKNYDGVSDIVLNEELGIVIKASENNLFMYKGQDIITTDGHTLLGADDKAGIAAIVSAMKFLVTHKDQIPHGRVRVCFLPDEEIGCLGAQRLDLKKFGCDYAYTLDACTVGELTFETFNAASAYITIHGRVVHPGYAKNKFVNALNLALEFHSMVPELERPEHTEGREGYFCLLKTEGEAAKATMWYLIRDHDKGKFEGRKERMLGIAKDLQKKYERFTGVKVDVEIVDSYRNMGEVIKQEHIYDPVVTTILESMDDIGVKPLIKAFRGGTDGARLSFKGLPCPNLFTGGENFHSRMEYLPIPSLVKAKELVVQIIKNYAKKFKKEKVRE